ncbi:MAG: hypothetical protein ACTSQ8_00140 [Candidatus Helarchaeota archaeon]
MTQINIQIDAEIDKILEELANYEGKSKSKLTKEYFLVGFREKLIPKLLELYAQEKITLKKLIKLAPIPYFEVFSLIAEKNIEPNIPPDLDDYTSEVAARAIKELKKHEEKVSYSR